MNRMEGFSSGEFLQGYLEETREHLQSINQHLLRLEKMQSQSGDDARLGHEDANTVEQMQLVNELFRSFHTIKGLSGMVGLPEASTLSHRMEAILHHIRGETFPLTPGLIDQLLAGTRTLSAVVDTLRGPQFKMPDISPDLEGFDALLAGQRTLSYIKTRPVEAAPAVNLPDSQELRSLPLETIIPGLNSYPELLKNLDPVEEGKTYAGVRAGMHFSLVTFASSAERAVRGENIDRMRQQLQEAGTLIKAVPVMQSGQMQFLFLVISPQPLDASALMADEVVPLVVQVEMKPEQPAITGAPRTSGHVAAVSPVVRVDLDRLDDLMRFAGDLILQRSRLGEMLSRLEGVPQDLRRELENNYQQNGRTLRSLRRAILRARMVPLAETFNRMPLVVRDLARSLQKDVRLVMQGENTEVDKMLVERLLDPLIHLVRNAISHGIESPAERVASGKPGQGTLTLSGVTEGDHILIEVSDDGRGVDLDTVAARAAALGWRASDQQLTAAEALEIITQPGFTTRGEADMGSGRGVGLDVVNRAVRSVGGQVMMESSIGRGTTFRMHLPLTLVIVDVLFVRAGKERFAVPRDAVERVIEIEPHNITRAESGEMIQENSDYLVLHRLAGLLGVRGKEEPSKKMFGLVAASSHGFLPVKNSGQQVLVVDQIIDMREVVVHTLADPLVTRPEFDGATELGDGSVILILDVPGLLNLTKKVN